MKINAPSPEIRNLLFDALSQANASRGSSGTSRLNHSSTCLVASELTVINLLQLVDQDHRGVAVGGEVAGRDRHREMLVGPVAELFHQCAGLGAALLHVGMIARKSLQHLRRHAPESARRGLHNRADVALALCQDVDERLAVERERHCPPQIGIVEGRQIAVDDQIAGDVCREHLADCVRRLARDVLQLRDCNPEIGVVFAGEE